MSQQEPGDNVQGGPGLALLSPPAAWPGGGVPDQDTVRQSPRQTDTSHQAGRPASDNNSGQINRIIIISIKIFGYKYFVFCIQPSPFMEGLKGFRLSGEER